jgi:hypothetical protein
MAARDISLAFAGKPLQECVTRECLLDGRTGSELVTCLTEGAFGEREDFGRRYREDEDRLRDERITIPVMEAALADRVVPSPIPLVGPRLSKTRERGVVGDHDGVALDHDIQPAVPVVAPSRQSHVRVAAQIDRLLLGAPRAEVKGSIEPHGGEWRDVGASVGSDRREPKQLGRLEHAARLIPTRGDRFRIAEARVDGRRWCIRYAHSEFSFRSLVMENASGRWRCGARRRT